MSVNVGVARWLVLAWLAGCTIVVVRPDETPMIRSLMLGNGHVSICKPGGVIIRTRSGLARPPDAETPVGADVLDVSVAGECIEMTGASTSGNLVIAIGLIVAAAASVVAILA